ncbi:MAG: hypothetical protein AAFY17_15705, partial [Cyanobacteria bacterium J06642_11]
MDVIKAHPLIDQILESWCGQIGDVYDGYRGHVYRMFNCCLALKDCSEEEVKKLAIAAAFHDIGLWSDHTVDYIPPSVVQAQQWLTANELSDWSEEIGLIIDLHHKVRPATQPDYPLVELFRKADLVDFSLGIFRFGLSPQYVAHLKSEIPNAGFNKFLLREPIFGTCQQ